MSLLRKHFRLTVALLAAGSAGLSACDQPLAGPVGPRPVVNVEIEAAAATTQADPAEVAAARATLDLLTGDWNAPGSIVRAQQASALASTLRAARAAEVERERGWTISVQGLLARARRAAAAADAAATVRGVATP